MPGILYAIVTVIAWGTWLAPSQNVAYKNQQIKTFYVAAANLALATLVFAFQGFRSLSWEVFWLPFIGGLVWAVSGYLAFSSTKILGLARAFGIWSPLNAITAMVWGILLFNEFQHAGPLTIFLLILALIVIIAGILMIIFAKGLGKRTDLTAAIRFGLLAAIGAGVLWGSYFIPLRLSGVSTWVGAFPLAVGIFIGSAILAALTRLPLRLASTSDTLRTLLTGFLWGIGNYAMLLLVEQLGAGRGYTISQLGVVVNSLIGVYIFKDPLPKTRAATLTIIGCIIATGGAILLGTLK
jgi:glucose uptake protein